MLIVFMCLVGAAWVAHKCAVASDHMNAFLAAEAARADKGQRDNERRPR